MLPSRILIYSALLATLTFHSTQVRAQTATAPPLSTEPAVIQVTLTVVDASAVPSLGLPITRDTQTGSRDDLHALQEKAAKLKAVLTISYAPNVTAADGVPAAAGAMTQVPANPLQPTSYISVGKTTRVVPHLLPNGTVRVEIAYTDVELLNSYWRETSTPQTMTESVTTTRTFHNGDTFLLGGSAPKGKPAHYVFATVMVKPVG